MPPKLRRPAAVPRPRRRPAGQVEQRADPGWIGASEVRLEELEVGCSLVVEGDYWEGASIVCGALQGAQLEGTGRYLKLKATGTKSEALLKYLSGSRTKEVVVHLCTVPCDSRIWDDLVHALRLYKVGMSRDPWMDNLKEQRAAVEDQEDANQELRREAELAHQELKQREAKKMREDERREENKVKKKKKKSERRLKASDGKKELSVIFGGTGLDPNPTVRKVAVRTAKKVRKKTKKKKKRSSSSKESSTGTSSSLSSEEVIDMELFEGQRETQRLWKKTPGTLGLTTVLEAQQSLLTRLGFQPDVSSAALPPIMVQYYRAHLQPVMSPALSRESYHWAVLMDLLLQGEVARGVDLAAQRLKSLESYAKGVALDVSRNMELLPPEKSLLASATETQLASKLSTEEMKLQQKTRYPSGGKGGESSSAYPGGKKGKSKGDGKKGKGDYKGPRKGKEEEKEKAG